MQPCTKHSGDATHVQNKAKNRKATKNKRLKKQSMEKALYPIALVLYSKKISTIPRN